MKSLLLHLAGCLFISSALAVDVPGFIEMEAAPGAVAVPVSSRVSRVFYLKNTGNEKRRISGLHKSCNCMQVTCEKDEIAPGESCKVEISLDTGNTAGKLERNVLVTFEGSKEITNLVLKLEVSREVLSNPEVLAWRVGEKAAPQTFVIFSPTDSEIKSIRILTKAAKFHVESPVKRADGSFHLEISPMNTDQSWIEPFDVECEMTAGHKRLLYSSLSIKNK